MKNILLFGLLIGIISCSDQELVNLSQNNNDSIALESRSEVVSIAPSLSGVSNQNGRLHFDNMDALNEYFNLIIEMVKHLKIDHSFTMK